MIRELWGALEVAEWEGPEGESLRVFWRWYGDPHVSGIRVPVAVEFDLFTSYAVQEDLLEDLRAVTVDRIRSVSAMPDEDEDAFPWE